MTATKRKLIEVAIPIDIINNASIRESSIRRGHPSTFHIWWARRPLATCRAVLFSQLVDDPSNFPDKFPTEEAISIERERLFEIMARLVLWEKSKSDSVLEEAKTEIRKCFRGELPKIYDPFSGGASIPLEAHRLGLNATGSDLNPVAVLIGKSLLEFPQNWRDREPFHPSSKGKNHYRDFDGLAEDILYYAEKLRNLVWADVGHLYPEIRLGTQVDSERSTALAWIWVRTIASPDPAMNGAPVPLVASYWLCKKKKKKVWVEPYTNNKQVRFMVKTGNPLNEDVIEQGNKAGRGANFVCQLSGTAITARYVKAEGNAGRLGWQLLAVVVDGKNGKKYVAGSEEQEKLAFSQEPGWVPDFKMSEHSQYMGVTRYGIKRWSKLFMPRQAIVLSKFLSSIPKALEKLTADSSYVKLIATYLALSVSRLTGCLSVGNRWRKDFERFENIFSMQALPMRWISAEGNPFSDSSANYLDQVKQMVSVISNLPRSGSSIRIYQNNATEVDYSNFVICTDPPYYDNIPYADLSDFFYVWLRKGLNSIHPTMFQTVLVPKLEELVADHERHLGTENAGHFFLSGMTEVLTKMAKNGSQDVPTTIFYAYRQARVNDNAKTSRGWATFLQAVFNAGYQVTATWPLRTEHIVGSKKLRNNLSTSIVLVCRPRKENSGSTTRVNFIDEIRTEIQHGLKQLRLANISPADIPQSSIGPGISVYTKYDSVLEADDSIMDVKTALQLINSELDDILNDLQGNFDTVTRFLISWYEQLGLNGGEFGKADSIAKARGTSVDNASSVGLVQSSGGIVRILHRSELADDWAESPKLLDTVWGSCQGVIRVLEQSGEMKAAAFLKTLSGTRVEEIKDLAYCLYDISVNKIDNAKEANSYNALISVWSDLMQHASASHLDANEVQSSLDLGSNNDG